MELYNLSKYLKNQVIFFWTLYNEEVQILSTITRGGEKYYKIRLADSSCILLPGWMTDRSFCRRFVLRADPYCSVAGLLELRHLLDCQEK